MCDRGHNRHRPKREGCCAPFAEGAGSHLTQCGLGQVLLPYQVASSSIQLFSHNGHEPKTGGCAPFWGKLRPHLTHSRLRRGLPLYQVASWSIQPFGHNKHGPKIGWGAVPYFLKGAGSPSNTKSPGLRTTSTPSGILVHPAVWPQQTLAENWGAVPL